jgi:hypothetical protein
VALVLDAQLDGTIDEANRAFIVGSRVAGGGKVYEGFARVASGLRGLSAQLARAQVGTWSQVALANE